MAGDRRFDSEDERNELPTEGVRIIGAEEAAEAIERGDVASRRSYDEPRFGDRPTPPPSDGPRPVLRFPLASGQDPTSGGAEVAPADPPSGSVELPHWTEPPSGQVPRILPDDEPPGAGPDDDLEDWAGFSAGGPRWRDDSTGYDALDDDMSFLREEGSKVGALDDSERLSHDEYLSFADLGDQAAPGRSVFADADQEWDPDPGRQPWDPVPSGANPAVGRTRRPGGVDDDTYASRRPVRVGGGGGDRDLGQAAVVGGALLAAAVLLLSIGPVAAMVLITAVVALAAAELYTALRQTGFQPVALVGIVASVGLVVGAYNYGYGAIPTVLFLATAVALIWYVIGAAVESPVLNVGVTLAGVLWVGLGGSFAALMLSLGDDGSGILLATILGTVGYDVGGLFIGRSAGRQPLSEASPNKTVEGLVGGCVVAFVVPTVIASLFGLGPIDSFAEGALVGLVVALAAPLGDLSESMVKRDLGIKDMGTLLPGHGGLMDRFDGLLFALPAVWLLATVRDFFL
ncbi:MAG: phosphatidate cytidylyltransferase [Acidimicrobiia bacterium]